MTILTGGCVALRHCPNRPRIEVTVDMPALDLICFRIAYHVDPDIAALGQLPDHPLDGPRADVHALRYVAVGRPTKAFLFGEQRQKPKENFCAGGQRGVLNDRCGNDRHEPG